MAKHLAHTSTPLAFIPERSDLAESPLADDEPEQQANPGKCGNCLHWRQTSPPDDFGQCRHPPALLEARIVLVEGNEQFINMFANESCSRWEKI